MRPAPVPAPLIKCFALLQFVGGRCLTVRRQRRFDMGLPLLTQPLSDQESEFEGLARIESRIAMGVVTRGQILLRDVLRSTQTLGHVLPRKFQMYATGMGALGPMYIEEG